MNAKSKRTLKDSLQPAKTDAAMKKATTTKATKATTCTRETGLEGGDAWIAVRVRHSEAPAIACGVSCGRASTVRSAGARGVQGGLCSGLLRGGVI